MNILIIGGQNEEPLSIKGEQIFV